MKSPDTKKKSIIWVVISVVLAIVVISYWTAAQQTSESQLSHTPDCSSGVAQPCVQKEQVTIKGLGLNYFDSDLTTRDSDTQIILQTRDGVETIQTDQRIGDLYVGETTYVYRINGQVKAIDTPHGRESIYLIHSGVTVFALVFIGVGIIAFAIAFAWGDYLKKQHDLRRKTKISKG